MAIEYNLVDRVYLEEIRKTKPLLKEREFELSKRIQENGDKKAIDELVKGNLKFVVSVALNYTNQGMDDSDLINEGNKGLIRAAKRYDYSRGFKFISYAVWWIRQGILQALAEQSRVTKIPLNIIGDFYKARKKVVEMEQKYKRPVTYEEAIRDLHKKDDEASIQHKIMSCIRLENDAVRLNSSKSDDERKTDELINNFADPNPEPADRFVDDSSLSKLVHDALSHLTEKESDIVKLYFGIDCPTQYTLDQIGKRFNLTRERVRQIKEKSISRLRKPYYGKKLRDY